MSRTMKWIGAMLIFVGINAVGILTHSVLAVLGAAVSTIGGILYIVGWWVEERLAND